MPVKWQEGRNLSPLIRRYEAEYIAKGCSRWKAYCLACKKARRKHGC